MEKNINSIRLYKKRFVCNCKLPLGRNKIKNIPKPPYMINKYDLCENKNQLRTMSFERLRSIMPLHKSSTSLFTMNFKRKN